MKLFIYIFLVSICFYSCEDAFETTLEIDVPEPPQILNVLSMVSDTVLDMRLGLNKVGNLDINSGSNVINDAEVTITNLSTDEVITFDNFPTTSTWDSNNYKASFPNDNWITSGIDYELTIEHPDYPVATAIQKVPFKTGIDQIVFYPNGGIDEDGNEVSGVEVFFQDNPEEENFYEVFIFTGILNNEILFTNGIIRVGSSDPSAIESFSYASLIVSDELFNGELKSLLLKIDRQWNNTEEMVYVKLRSITRDHYQFSKTAKNASETEDNPFQTPVQVHSNIENGLGIFTIYSDDNKRISIN